MDQPKDTFIIYGVQENGKKLRPTDGVERISSTLASVDAKKRLHYSLAACDVHRSERKMICSPD